MIILPQLSTKNSKNHFNMKMTDKSCNHSQLLGSDVFISIQLPYVHEKDHFVKGCPQHPRVMGCDR